MRRRIRTFRSALNCVVCIWLRNSPGSQPGRQPSRERPALRFVRTCPFAKSWRRQWARVCVTVKNNASWWLPKSIAVITAKRNTQNRHAKSFEFEWRENRAGSLASKQRNLDSCPIRLRAHSTVREIAKPFSPTCFSLSIHLASAASHSNKR